MFGNTLFNSTYWMYIGYVEYYTGVKHLKAIHLNPWIKILISVGLPTDLPME